MDIAAEAMKEHCYDYGMYAKNQDDSVQGGVEYTTPYNRSNLIMSDLRSILMNTKNPQIDKTLNIRPEYIQKIYYHVMQTETQVMIIGVITTKSRQDDFIVEHVI
jgi:hypothetical protein